MDSKSADDEPRNEEGMKAAVPPPTGAQGRTTAANRSTNGNELPDKSEERPEHNTHEVEHLVNEPQSHQSQKIDASSQGEAKQLLRRIMDGAKSETSSVDSLQCIRDYVQQFVKSDREVIEHLMVACLSSYTDNPLNLGLFAPSSIGKTWATKMVAQLFSNTVFLSGATAKSFFYDGSGKTVNAGGEDIGTKILALKAMLAQEKLKPKMLRNPKRMASLTLQINETTASALTEVNLEGRILVFLEPPDQAVWNGLKPLLSHDVYYSIYQTVSKSNSLVRKIRLVGWPVCIFASARDEQRWYNWDEIRTRFVIITPDSTEQKFLEANRLTAKLSGEPKFVLSKLFPQEKETRAKEAVTRIRQQIEALRISCGAAGKGEKTDNFVFNPFASLLAERFYHESGDRMRHFRYVLNYANLFTLINIERRPLLLLDGEPKGIVTMREDVERALALVCPNIKASLPRVKLEFLEKVVKPLAATLPPGTGFTAREVHESAVKHNLRLSRKTVQETYLSALEDDGLLFSETSSEDRRERIYYLHEVTGQESAKFFEGDEITLRSVKEVWNEHRKMFVYGRGVEAEFQGKVFVSAEDFANLCLWGCPSKNDSGAKNKLLEGNGGGKHSNRIIGTNSEGVRSEKPVDPAPAKGEGPT